MSRSSFYLNVVNKFSSTQLSQQLQIGLPPSFLQSHSTTTNYKGSRSFYQAIPPITPTLYDVTATTDLVQHGHHGFLETAWDIVTIATRRTATITNNMLPWARSNDEYVSRQVVIRGFRARNNLCRTMPNLHNSANGCEIYVGAVRLREHRHNF
jgi:hypothetical protein